jgi:hypothetical protein
MQSGYFAAIAFLVFTGGGSAAQLAKLFGRIKLEKRGALTKEQICEGLHPVRELWSFTAFSLFALSGLTRSYTDYILIGTRIPVIALSTATLAIMSLYQGGRATTFFRWALAADAAVLAVLILVESGVSFDGTMVSLGIDGALSLVSFLLFYGKTKQARTMFQTRKTRAVSWLRELGIVIKDGTGLWYALQVGSELKWIALTHVLSGLSSASICLSKWLVERKNEGAAKRA